LGLFVIQRQRTEQAEEQRHIQEGLNLRLAEQIAVADSLRLETEATNVQLGDQFAVTDSIRQEEEAANEELTTQISVSNRLRRQSDELRLVAEAANEQLTEQIGVSDSLRGVSESLLESARSSRIETITIALASHAMRQLRLGDAELGALLARQAYQFSKGGNGAFIAPVHEALMASLDALGEKPALDGFLEGASVRSVAYAPDNAHVAWGDENGAVTLASINRDGAVTTKLGRQTAEVRTVAYNPDPNQNIIASGGLDGRVLLWEDPLQADTKPVVLGDQRTPIWTVAFSADGSRLASAGQGTEIKLWDVKSRQQSGSIPVEGGRIRSVQFSPVAPLLAAAGDDGFIRIWDLQNTDAPPTSWQTSQGRVQAVAFGPDGTQLASGGTTTEIRLWVLDADSGDWSIGPVLQGHEGPINALAFSPHGTRLASGSADHNVQVWDLSQPTISPILIQGHSSWVWSLAFKPDGSELVSAGADKHVLTWYVDLAQMADRICTAVDDRELTPDEWSRFVGVDVPYHDNYEPCATRAASQLRGQNPELGAVNR
ncbi:MAG: WD40 repeat domain-containing protein, partial [Rhodothermales bacterium]